MIEAARQQLRHWLPPDTPINIERVVESPETATGIGSAITLVAATDTGCRFGATVFRDPRRKQSPADCGRAAADGLRNEVGAGGCVDQFVQDQLLIFMALAEGRSEVRVGALTDHTRLAMATAERLLPCEFTVRREGPTNIIACEGVGLTAPGCISAAAAGRGFASRASSAVVPGNEAGAERPKPETPKRLH